MKPSQHPARTRLRHPGRQDRGERLAVPDRLHAQEDQVHGARDPDDGEHDDRPLDQRANAEGDANHVHVHAILAGRHGRDAGRAAELQRPADDEQHVRSRRQDQQIRQHREGKQVLGGEHERQRRTGTATGRSGLPARVQQNRTEAPGYLFRNGLVSISGYRGIRSARQQ
jgi:hypothetical protein